MDNPVVNNRVIGPDGTVTVAWVTTIGGHKVLVSRQRSAASRTWGPTEPVTPLDQDVLIFEFVTDDAGNTTAIWADPVAPTREAGSSTWSAPEVRPTARQRRHGASGTRGLWRWNEEPPARRTT